MPDPRKPDAVVSIRVGGNRHVFELFKASQFGKKADMRMQAQLDDHDNEKVRVRLNGAWMPPGQRLLMTIEEALSLVEATLRRGLSDE